MAATRREPDAARSRRAARAAHRRVQRRQPQRRRDAATADRALSRELSEEEQRTASEGLTEAELAVFDLLTKPDPVLTDEEREQVKRVAKHLMEHIQEKLVLDWRRKAETMADVRVAIRDVLDKLPADPYPRDVFDTKVQIVFDHVFTVYVDDGVSVYAVEPAASVAGVGPVTSIDEVTEAVIERIRTDAEFAELVARQLRGVDAIFAQSVEELLANDEDDEVEFKSTARWNVRQERRNQVIEDAIVKTIAAFLNTEGGTLLIGVGPDGSPVGLAFDYPHVQPENGDGFVNWLTTHLTNALGTAAVMRTRARIVVLAGVELCRLDVAPSSQPTWAKTSTEPRVFFVRMNNSSRAMPDGELEAYMADRWPALVG